MGLDRTLCANLQAPRSVAAQSDLRTIHLEHARVPAGGAESRGDAGAGYETKLHQAACIFSGQLDTVEDSGIAFSQIHQARVRCLHLAAVATQLQHGFSMLESEILVKMPNGLATFFSCHNFPGLAN